MGKDTNFYLEIVKMTNYGFSFLVNGCSIKNNQYDNYFYAAYVPDNITEPVKDYFSSQYDYLKQLIERDSATFLSDVISNGEVENSQAYFNLDDFYTLGLGLDKKKKMI